MIQQNVDFCEGLYYNIYATQLHNHVLLRENTLTKSVFPLLPYRKGTVIV